MRIAHAVAFAILAALGASGCSSTKVLAPPRLDLSRHGAIGLIEFSSTDSVELGRHASQEFLAAMYAAQPGVTVVELGEEARVLREMGSDALDAKTLRAIGDRYRLDAVFVGVLEADDVRPKASVAGSWSASASAEVECRLSTRLVETLSGATLWSTAARGREAVARLSLGEGTLDADARSPDEARGRLVHVLVDQATADLWPDSAVR